MHWRDSPWFDQCPVVGDLPATRLDTALAKASNGWHEMSTETRLARKLPEAVPQTRASLPHTTHRARDVLIQILGAL